MSQVLVSESPAESAEQPAQPDAGAGGSKELLKLALPLIVSQSFATVQIFIDTVLLAWHDPREMTATLPAMLWFWQLFGLLQVTAGYTSTFVAQYTGANRPHRVGPAVWQGIHFAVIAGLVFLVMIPLAPFLMTLGQHTPELQKHETTYLQCLSFAALPMLVMAAVNGFFSGRGQTWTVLCIEVFGTAVNVCLALVLIFGQTGVPKLGLPGVPGVPELGIAGAGWATVAGSWAAALLAIGLFLRREYREQFDSLKGWRPEGELFRRLMKFGGPAGMQVFQDVMVFNVFVLAVGALGEAAAGASTLAVRLNMIAFLPMMGMGQAVCILVGQRLGGDRPDLAERSTHTGLKWMFGYMATVAAVYLLLPRTLVGLFEGDRDVQDFEAVAVLVPNLLICVATYSLAESFNLAFAFALRGAGDTKFVSRLTFALGWPIMVIPTLLVVWLMPGLPALYWSWVFATAYIFVMAVCFWWRFRGGKWKTMRVIEAVPEVG